MDDGQAEPRAELSLSAARQRQDVPIEPTRRTCGSASHNYMVCIAETYPLACTARLLLLHTATAVIRTTNPRVNCCRQRLPPLQDQRRVRDCAGAGQTG